MVDKSKRFSLGFLLLALTATLLLAGPALAQIGSGGSPRMPEGPAAGYSLDWSTIDGGGQTVSRGGGYILGGTLGQPDAGLLKDGGYSLGGGFWGGGALSGGRYTIYLPLVLRH